MQATANSRKEILLWDGAAPGWHRGWLAAAGGGGGGGGDLLEGQKAPTTKCHTPGAVAWVVLEAIVRILEVEHNGRASPEAGLEKPLVPIQCGKKISCCCSELSK